MRRGVSRLIGAILLVAGTTIGAGMLALPMTTGLAGFIPSLLIMTAIWLFMMLTAFYLLEVNLRMKGESNLISMVHVTLGKHGEVVAWLSYLLLLYALTAAYLLGCSQILQHVAHYFFPHLDIPASLWPICIFCIFGIFVFFGTHAVDLLNRFLMIGLGVGYMMLIAFGIRFIEVPDMAYQDWHYLLPSLSVVVTTFGYHIIIPTLSIYLDHDPKLLKKAIVIGSLIPFVIYLIWQFFVMGLLPIEGENSLMSARTHGIPVTFYLQALLQNPWVTVAGQTFAFFSIVTSLLGVSLSLTDFLADGLKIKKTHFGKCLLILATFVPPLLFAIFYPQGFVAALRYAGIFVVILLALLPSLMVYYERYRRKNARDWLKSTFSVVGGKPLLCVTIFISITLLLIELL